MVSPKITSSWASGFLPMTDDIEKRACGCIHCSDLGLIFPAKKQFFRSLGAAVTIPGPVRPLPVPCAFCVAGEVEERVIWEIAQREPGDGEFELKRFRREKG